MHRDLSVYDNIRYSANVRLPASWTAKQREDHVAATVSALQLKHVQDVLVGDEAKRGVSGGQRKRCNIGMEVAAAPSLLLLDEPTSGTASQRWQAKSGAEQSACGYRLGTYTPLLTLYLHAFSVAWLHSAVRLGFHGRAGDLPGAQRFGTRFVADGRDGDPPAARGNLEPAG